MEFRILLLFVIIYNIQTVYGHDSKSSLTFVIDETYSMKNDIEEVKSQTKKLFTEVLNKESSNIGEVVLVTFGDDFTKLRAITKDSDVFLGALEKVTAFGGGDCPEGSMAGILLGLEKSANNSFIYVFTDASAKDYLMYEEVKRLSQKKSIQVNFLLTGLCKTGKPEAYLVYHKLAAATSGQVILVTKKNLRKVIDFIIESMKSKKVLLAKKIFTSGTNRIAFNTDSHIHNVWVSMAIFGKDENWEDNILIVDSKGIKIKYDILVDVETVKVLQIPFMKPGSYKVTVKIYYKTSIFISAASDICFQHGFSDSKPTSIKETCTQPNLGSESYLSIALTNVARDVELNEAELIDEDDNVIMKVPLKLVDSGKQLYITEPLDPPKKMFKVVINGHTDTKERIRREGATYIESLKLTTIPVIDKIKKVYTFKKQSKPKVTCRVIKGYPIPNISWTFKNKLATDFQMLESKDKTNSIDTPEEGEYRCLAQNVAGIDSHSIEVRFETEIPEIDKIEKEYKFKKGSKAELTCRIIKGYPKPTLSWSYKNKLAIDFQALESTDETISIDTPEEGEYRCQAQNVAGEDSHSMEILFKDELPEIDKTENEYKLKKGSKVDLNCRIIKGYPKPTLSWSYKNKLSTDFQALGSKDETISIDSPEEGEYRCQAQNVAGIDFHSIEILFEDEIPEIDKSENVYKFKKGPKVQLTCRIIKGYPEPTLSWSYKNKLATDYQALDSKDETISIDTSEEGEYRCQAQNSAGADSHSMKIEFEDEIPEIDKTEKVYQFKKGSKVELTCRIIKGYPKPTLSWSYKNKLATDFQALDSKDETISIDTSEEGEYRCQAQNSAGADSHSMKIEFEDEIPEIDKTEKVYQLKKGSKVKLTCRIIKGYPKPTLSWSYKNKLATDFQELGNKDEIISIDTPEEGEYRCHAQNSAGEDSHNMQILFKGEIPEIDKTEKVHQLKKGSKVELTCRIIKGYPKPTLSWSYKNKLATDLQALDSKDETISIDTSEEGEYRCQAQNSAGADSHSMKIEFEDEIPEIDKTEKVYQFKKESKVELTCRIIKGYPKPTLSWSYKNKLATDFQELGNKDEIISIDTPEEGEYRCQAQNIAGEDSHSMEVVFEDEIPEIDKTQKVHTFKKGAKVELNCRIIKGYPKPNLSWYYKNKFAKDYQPLDNKDETIQIDTLGEGKYRCEAENNAGKDFHSVTVVFEGPPEIKSLEREINVSIAETVSIPCLVDGAPPPDVIWVKDSVELYTGNKYQIFKDHTLRFTAELTDSGDYTCTAQNIFGVQSITFKVNVYVPVTQVVTNSSGLSERDPVKIEIPNETNIKIVVGSTLKLSCTASGSPELKIQFTYLSLHSTSEPNILKERNSQNQKFTLEYSVNYIQELYSGYYTCHASNAYSFTTLTYTVTVLEPPAITSYLRDRELYAVEGDLALQIPCEASGNPKPTIFWTVNGKNFVGGKVGVQKENMLVLNNLKLDSSGTYTCFAENGIGPRQSKTYNLQVDPYPRVSGKITKTLLVDVQKRIIKCGIPYGPGDLVRWFKDGKLINQNTGELPIDAVKTSDAGIYTCRVSNHTAAQSYHTEVIVGSKPTFSTSVSKQPIEYKEDSRASLDCDAKGHPEPQIKWTFDGHKIYIPSMLYTISKMKSKHIGVYLCNVTNDFGSVTRSFQIKGEECQLSIARDFNGNQPMIMTSSLKFPSLQTLNGFVMVPMKPMFLICPTGTFNYPGLEQRTKITITCITGSLFDVQGMNIKFSDLKCKKKIEPYIRSNNRRCIKTKSELYSVGYKLGSKFVGVYDVCFDKKKNIPVFALYSLHKDISNTLPSVEPTFMMSAYTHHFDEFYDRSQQTNKLSSILGQAFERDSCYFSQRQLVNSRDMVIGTAQTSTYSYLNIFPHYSTCYKENWDVVESKLRHVAMSLDFDLHVWAGTSHLMPSPNDSVNVTLRNSLNQAQFVPLFLWKVVESKELRGSIAIIQINLPNLTLPEALKYVLCKDICNEIDWLQYNEWHNIKRGYIYCCSIKDFEKAFNFQRLFNFGPPDVLKTISNVVKKTNY